MKYCPECKRVYEEDIRFCYGDGTSLSSVVDSAKDMTLEKVNSGKLASPSVENQKTRSQVTLNMDLRYIFGGIFALAAASTLIYWMSSSPNSTNNIQTTATSPSPTTDTEQERLNEQRESLRIEQTRIDLEKQQLATERSKTATLANRGPATPESVTTDARSSGGKWFVVLGTYQKSERVKADQRLQYVQGRG